MGLIAKFFGTKNDRELKILWPRVSAINELESGIKKLSDEDIVNRVTKIRKEITLKDQFQDNYNNLEKMYK